MKVNKIKHIVTIFGSSKPSAEEPEYKLAYELGKLLAENSFDICNGGYGGVMEASALGAKNGGGKSIGIVTEHFQRLANPYIAEVICVKTLMDRLLKLVELGDAYVILRGSTGTLVELATVWEYMNKSAIKSKPIIIIGDFWFPLINTLKTELNYEGMKDVTKFISIVESPKECVKLLIDKLK